MNIEKKLSWKVLEFFGQSTSPKTIKRLSDGEVFSVSDYVTNGTKMRGKIEAFNFSFQDNEVFVETTWSRVQMNLDSLSKIINLPSSFQIDDEVVFSLAGDLNAKVKGVHFYSNKIKYDLELKQLQVLDGIKTRVYNIDEVYVHSLERLI